MRKHINNRLAFTFVHCVKSVKPTYMIIIAIIIIHPSAICHWISDEIIVIVIVVIVIVVVVVIIVITEK